MNCVESRRTGGPIDPPPPHASCNYFFFEASRVKRTMKKTMHLSDRSLSDRAIQFRVIVF